jgi:hypothetical protein
MSYDLFFVPKNHGCSLVAESFRDYFAAREHFTVENNQACYTNDDTGVYFSFDFKGGNEREPSDDEDGDQGRYLASFNLNYFRPHIFGLEAEPEVAAFVQQFDLRIDDPQFGGMEQGEYSHKGFLDGWNAGNEFGYKAIISQNGLAAVAGTLDSQTIERYWTWNFGRRQFQKELGDNIFVPRVSFCSYDGEVASFAVWPNGIPIALPVTDLLLVGRDRKKASTGTEADNEFSLVRFADAKSLVHKFPRKIQGTAFHLLDYQRPPAIIEHWVDSLALYEKSIEGLAVGSILDAELVAKFAGTVTKKAKPGILGTMMQKLGLLRNKLHS